MPEDESQASEMEAFPADRPLRWRRDLTLLAAGVACFIAFRVMFLVPGLVETVYARGIGPFVARPISLLSGLVPLSMVELVVVAYGSWMLLAFLRAAPTVARKERSVTNVTLSGGLRLAGHAGIVIALFYLLWGFNYARPPLLDRMGWPEWDPPEKAELILAATHAVDAANQAYWEIHQTEEADEPTQMPDLAELNRALDEGWMRAAESLDLGGSAGKRYGRTKRLLLTPIVARFGIAGFYFPWTAEANVLWDSPAVARPQSMAHEKAHQRGVGPENEASFLGFVAGVHAPHAHARYSAYVFAQGQILSVLSRADREAAREIAERRYRGIVRDLEHSREYWNRFRGIGNTVGRTVNNRFLRTNRVEGGLLSYGLSVRLLLELARQNDWKLVAGN